MDVRYENRTDKRFIKCFCGEECFRTVLPHMKKQHKREWDLWISDFARLYNDGWSTKRIMVKYKVMFTWTVIEKELRTYFSKHPEKYKVKKKKFVSSPPKDHEFDLPSTTVWSFPKRGKWSVHNNDYRGNWPPQLVRSLLMKYSKPNDIVLDPFVGGATTLIESYLMGRKSIGIDISPIAIKISKQKTRQISKGNKNAPVIIKADSKNLDEELKKLNIKTVDLVCAHPPYLDALKYTENFSSDLSHIDNIKDFCDKMQVIAKKLKNVLKKDGYCCVLIGDVRKNGSMVPVGFEMMKRFLDEGFKLEDTIIKVQYRDSSDPFYFKSENIKHRIAHEYLFIFKNPS